MKSSNRTWVTIAAIGGLIATPFGALASAPSRVDRLVDSIMHQAPPTDVAINLRSGETFIAERVNNPMGEVLVLKDSDLSYRETIQILHSPDPEAQIQIKLNKADELSYLVQSGDRWRVGGFHKEDGQWKKNSWMHEVRGDGQVSHLVSLPDGRLAMTLVRPQASEKEVLLIEGNTQQKGYKVIENIPESRVQAEVNRLISEQEPEVASGHGLGFTAGITSGIGMAYRRHFANYWGVQVGGIAYGDSSSIDGNVGVNILYTLSKTKFLRFYALAGASVFYSNQQVTNYDYPPCPVGATTCPSPVETTSRNKESHLNIGAGIGMEFTIARNLGISIELPLTTMFKDSGDGFSFDGIYPIPNGSLIYYF